MTMTGAPQKITYREAIKQAIRDALNSRSNACS